MGWVVKGGCVPFGREIYSGEEMNGNVQKTKTGTYQLKSIPSRLPRQTETYILSSRKVVVSAVAGVVVVAVVCFHINPSPYPGQRWPNRLLYVLEGDY